MIGTCSMLTNGNLADSWVHWVSGCKTLLLGVCLKLWVLDLWTSIIHNDFVSYIPQLLILRISPWILQFACRIFLPGALEMDIFHYWRQEGKLQQARRIAPEWSQYDEELQKIIDTLEALKVLGSSCKWCLFCSPEDRMARRHLKNPHMGVVQSILLGLGQTLGTSLANILRLRRK